MGPKRPLEGHRSPQCWLISCRTKPRMSSSWEHQTTEITKHPRIPGSTKGPGCRDHEGSIESGAQGPGVLVWGAGGGARPTPAHTHRQRGFSLLATGTSRSWPPLRATGGTRL